MKNRVGETFKPLPYPVFIRKLNLNVRSLHINENCTHLFKVLSLIHISITTGFYISKDFGYTFDEQIRDVASSYISGALMAVIVLCVGEMFSAITLWSLLIKVLAGVVSYILISLIAKPKPVRLVLSYLRIGNR